MRPFRSKRLGMWLLFGTLLAVSGMASSQQGSATVPEDARRYYVQANAQFKEAQSPDDYRQAVSLYQQALQLAPHFGNAWYNLAKAQEKLQQYDEAMASLKHFLADSPNDPESRAAQDHVYELELKRDAKAKVVADQQQAEKAAQDADQQRAAWARLISLQIQNRFNGLTVVGMLVCGEGNCTKEEAEANNWHRLNPIPGQVVTVDIDAQNRVRFIVSRPLTSPGLLDWYLCGTPSGPSLSDVAWADCEPSAGKIAPIVNLNWVSNGHKAIRYLHWGQANGRYYDTRVWEF